MKATDKRSKTSSVNGKKGGRPKELKDFKALPEENWRPIDGFESYFISSLGRLVSIKSGIPRLLKSPCGKNGYPVCVLGGLGKRKSLYIHRLVLQSFIGDCPSGMEASHLDGDRTNARLNNLLWETPLDNNRRKAEHSTQLRGEGIASSKLTERHIILLREFNERFNWTHLEMSKWFGISRRQVGKILQGVQWRHVK